MSTDPVDLLRSIARVSARELRLIAAKSKGAVATMECGDDGGVLQRTAQVLHRMRVPYALIGGSAVGFHAGFPRSSEGIDFALRTSDRNPSLVKALVAAGFELRGEHPHSINFRHASGEPVQFAFDEPFDAMVERAESFAFEGTSIRIVSREDLIAMKRRASEDPARRRSKALQDRADVELLSGDVPEPDEGW